MINKGNANIGISCMCVSHLNYIPYALPTRFQVLILYSKVCGPTSNRIAEYPHMFTEMYYCSICSQLSIIHFIIFTSLKLQRYLKRIFCLFYLNFDS